jgi:hypothetical protein
VASIWRARHQGTAASFMKALLALLAGNAPDSQDQLVSLRTLLAIFARVIDAHVGLANRPPRVIVAR